MNLSYKKTIKNLLKTHNLQPVKRLGQNFLVDKAMLKRIVENAMIDSKDTILEIGPGIGTLTQELAKKAKKVIAVEKDRNMVSILKDTLKDFKNIEVVHNDILKMDLELPKNCKVIGNLPFYVATPTIRKFLELSGIKSPMVFILQKEVAQRICSKPPKMSILAVSVQFYATPKIISYVSKKSFWPQPKVDAAIIKITPKTQTVGDSKLFFKIVKAGFSHPRKQLINNLSKGLTMEKKQIESCLLKSGLKPSQRAETLTVEDWTKLVNILCVIMI